MIAPESRPQMTGPEGGPREQPRMLLAEQPRSEPSNILGNSFRCPHEGCSASFFIQQNLGQHIADCHALGDVVEEPKPETDYGVT